LRYTFKVRNSMNFVRIMKVEFIDIYSYYVNSFYSYVKSSLYNRVYDDGLPVLGLRKIVGK
jgi:hypothetical protein